MFTIFQIFSLSSFAISSKFTSLNNYHYEQYRIRINNKLKSLKVTQVKTQKDVAENDGLCDVKCDVVCFYV